jgi:galactokinase
MADIKTIIPGLKQIYGVDNDIIEKQIERYQDLKQNFVKRFGYQSLDFFSTPGRTEIGGNHTDHNHGRVIAASVNLDSIATAAKNNNLVVTIYSDGYKNPFVVDLSDLSIYNNEKEETSALIRGIAAKFAESGFEIGGFDCCMSSTVLPGSGLSSSASVEVLIGTIFNHLFNDGKIAPEEIAKIGQFAENNYFGKPCGLMDQMACAVGGIISIDFADPVNPVVKKINFDFSRENFSLLVVDTGGNHSDLTDDYAAIPAEMKAVAGFFGAEYLRDVSFDTFREEIPKIRNKFGDRAVLRAFHFLKENERVMEQVKVLEDGEFQSFLNHVNASGNSSFKWLQNIYTFKNVNEQGLTLALSLTENFIKEIKTGACRVHGGGFAGTIQVFLPDTAVKEYINLMQSVFDENSVMVLGIRQVGTVKI